MTNIQVFNFNSSDINVQVDEYGVPWFRAKDICDALDIQNSRQAVKQHVDEEDARVFSEYTSIGSRDMNFINESGMYSLVLSSRKPEAKKFKKWVTTEVIPSIRKTGAFVLKTPTKKEYAMMLLEAEERVEHEHQKFLTARASAGGFSAEVNRRRKVMDDNWDNASYASVVDMAKRLHIKLHWTNFSKNVVMAELKRIAYELDKPASPSKTPDSDYPILRYHRDVWFEFDNNVKLEELFPKTPKAVAKRDARIAELEKNSPQSKLLDM